jgi:hypothetical protein
VLVLRIKHLVFESVAGVVGTRIRRRGSKGFVCLIGYFLVVCTSAEIVLGLVKTLETSN